MILFDEKTHTYTDDGKHLISVTQLMKKHGLAPSYEGVSEAVLGAKAQRGTLIHKEIEAWCKSGEIGISDELLSFVQYISGKNVTVEANEIMAFNDICAGTIDLITKEGDQTCIADIKTTETLHTEAVAWQLSIYAYLHGGHFDKAQAYHFDKDGKLNVVEIPFKPREEIERLMECERKGEIYCQDLDFIAPSQLAELEAVQNLIAEIEAQKKEAEAKREEMTKKIMAAMEERGVKTADLGKVRLTYVPETTRVSIDTAMLKKCIPEIADKFTKETKVKASLRVTVR